MIASVARWGNSLALRIPSAFARQIDVTEGSSVDVSVEAGGLLVRPVENVPTYAIEDLLDQITEDNLHGEIATGHAIGKEFQ